MPSAMIASRFSVSHDWKAAGFETSTPALPAMAEMRAPVSSATEPGAEPSAPPAVAPSSTPTGPAAAPMAPPAIMPGIEPIIDGSELANCSTMPPAKPGALIIAVR